MIAYTNGKKNAFMAAVIEDVSFKPFGADPHTMMSVVKGLYSLKPGRFALLHV